jgi:hypothetical protein
MCDLANALLQSSGMPDIWWGEVVLTVCYVLNRVPPRNREATPYEGFKGRKSDLSHLRTWGCLAKVNVPLPKKRKLGPKTFTIMQADYLSSLLFFKSCAHCFDLEIHAGFLGL